MSFRRGLIRKERRKNTKKRKIRLVYFEMTTAFTINTDTQVVFLHQVPEIIYLVVGNVSIISALFCYISFF